MQRGGRPLGPERWEGPGSPDTTAPTCVQSSRCGPLGAHARADRLWAPSGGKHGLGVPDGRLRTWVFGRFRRPGTPRPGPSRSRVGTRRDERASLRRERRLVAEGVVVGSSRRRRGCHLWVLVPRRNRRAVPIRTNRPRGLRRSRGDRSRHHAGASTPVRQSSNPVASCHSGVSAMSLGRTSCAVRDVLRLTCQGCT